MRDQTPMELARSMIPGLNVVDQANSVVRGIQDSASRAPNAQSQANDAQRAAMLRLQRLQAQRDMAIQNGDHTHAADLDAFISHLQNGGQLQTAPAQPAAPAARRVSPQVAQRRNALAGMKVQ